MFLSRIRHFKITLWTKNIIQLVEPKSEYIIKMTHQPTGIVWPLTLEFISTDLANSNIKQYIYETETQPLISLGYFREMCKGVKRIHVNQIRHRDLKPANFFVVDKDDVCLGDFGSSRSFRFNGRALVENYPVPTWRGEIFYTAPELFGLTDVDSESFRRADIYSLGAILFEMFTKQKLYPYVFDERFNSQILAIIEYGLGGLPLAGERLKQIVTQIVRNVQLPEIYDLDADIPLVIRERLNRVYEGGANLDYKKRAVDRTQKVME